MKQVYDEVYSAEELQDLVGCKIISVTGADGDEGLCVDTKDDAGNLVSFLITEESTWHLHKSKPVQNTRDGALTKDKILKMKPGRQMDLHIAIDVAGMHIAEIDKTMVPNYSTDDVAALQLLQGLYRDGRQVEILGHQDSGWYVTIKEYDSDEIVSVCYPTLAESIGKASLLAANGF